MRDWWSKRLAGHSTKNNRISKKLRYFILSFFIVLGSGYQMNKSEIRTEETRNSLEASVALIQRMVENGTIEANEPWGTLIVDLYKLNAFKPLWTKGFTLTPQAEEIQTFFTHSMRFGLDTAFYQPAKIRSAIHMLYNEKQFENLVEARIKADLVISQTVFTALIHLSKGVQFANKSPYNSTDSLVLEEMTKELLELSTAVNAFQALCEHQPNNSTFRKVQKAWEVYLLKHNAVKNLAHLQEDSDTFLNNRLIAAGYVDNNTTWNDSIQSLAIQSFQLQHGITPSGIADKPTLEALSKPMEFWFRKAAITLEKIKTDSIQEDESVFVNIPSYELHLLKKGTIEASYRVMVGTPKNQTPELTSSLDRIVTNPGWTVPASITKKELIHKIKRDSTYLSSRNFVVRDKNNQIIEHAQINWVEVTASGFDMTLQQLPGKGNALGNIKFLFPNEHAVYIHDTPSRSLFKKNYRAFSHGCVRLQNPADFADKILSELRRSDLYSTVKPLIHRGITREIRLDHPMPIYLRYYTAWTDIQGNIQFFNDVYSLESSMDAILPGTE